MKIKISGVIPESVVDGEGVRLVIFTQGCPHHCDGCHNGHTWDIHGGKMMDTEDFRELMRNPLLNGITISGGEPFIQQEACAELADMAHSMGLNVWCYTGWTYEVLNVTKTLFSQRLLDYVDILVDGPFRKELKSMECKFRGSKNQRIIDVKKSQKERKVVLYDCK